MPGLAVNLAPRNPLGLVWRNPVAAAAGTFGYGNEYARIVDIQRLGAIFSKGTTLHPRRGAPPPRLGETPGGVLNAIGLQNPGIRRVLREKAPVWADWQVPVIVNVAGESIEDYVEVAAALNDVPGIAGIELNVSCPNVEAGGIIFGCDPVLAAAVTREVRSATDLPLVVKLSPNVTDVRPVAEAVAAAGADAISLVNTFLGMSINVRSRRPTLGNITGGLSGPAIKPIAVRMVYQVAGVVDLPLIGVGGISTLDDALEFMMAGATAIQVGTATFARPGTMVELIDELAVWMDREGVADVGEIVGVARQC